MKGGCANIVKYLMILFNFLFFVGGSTLVGVGAWILLDGESFQKILTVTNSALFSAVWIILIVGGFLSVVGFLGCCGAYRENKCLVFLFFIFILGVFLLEIIGGILAFVFFSEVEDYMTDLMENKYGNVHENRITTDNWNALQSVWECCGIHGPTDWNNTAWVRHRDNADVLSSSTYNITSADVDVTSTNATFLKTNQPVSKWAELGEGQYLPESCCRRVNVIGKTERLLNRTNCLLWSPDDAETYIQYINTNGCKETASMYFILIGVVALCIMIVEMFGMLLSCCLYRGIVTTVQIANRERIKIESTRNKLP